MLPGIVSLATSSNAVPKGGATPPSVGIILADNLGYGELGCYGHPKFMSPRLDQMAAESVRLTLFDLKADPGEQQDVPVVEDVKRAPIK